MTCLEGPPSHFLLIQTLSNFTLGFHIRVRLIYPITAQHYKILLCLHILYIYTSTQTHSYMLIDVCMHLCLHTFRPMHVKALQSTRGLSCPTLAGQKKNYRVFQEKGSQVVQQNFLSDFYPLAPRLHFLVMIKL